MLGHNKFVHFVVFSPEVLNDIFEQSRVHLSIPAHDPEKAAVAVRYDSPVIVLIVVSYNPKFGPV